MHIIRLRSLKPISTSWTSNSMWNVLFLWAHKCFLFFIIHFEFLSDHLSIIHYDFCILAAADAALIALFFIYIQFLLMLFHISLANMKCNTYTHILVYISLYTKAKNDVRSYSSPFFMFCLLRSIAPIRKSNHPIVTRDL